MFYADDAVLLATSPVILQKLLNICSFYADKHELAFNVKKTKCMIITTRSFNDSDFSKYFHINGKAIEFTKTQKYLGCIISDDGKDNKDISRLMRSVYFRGVALTLNSNYLNHIVTHFMA